MEEENSPWGLEGGHRMLTDQEGAEGGVSSPVIRLSGPLPSLNRPAGAAGMARSLFLISTNAVEAVFRA